MPLYPYRCTQCGHRFEKIQSFSAEPETECPKCHGLLERTLTAPRLHFKGAGWYVNDYASKSSDPSSESSSESSSSEAKAPAVKADSASAAPAAAPAPAASSNASSSSSSAAGSSVPSSSSQGSTN